MTPERRLALIRLAGFALVLGIAFGVMLLAGGVPRPTEVREWGEDLGPAAPVLAIPLFVVINFLIAWPILAGATGLLFGALAGTPVALAGVTLAALAQMAVARYLVGDQVGKLLPERTKRFERLIERRGTVAILYSRIVPALPFGAVNYGAGLTRLRFPQMALGTAVGGAPKVFGYTALGGSLDDLSKPEAKIAIGLMVGLAVVGLFAARRELRAERSA